MSDLFNQLSDALAPRYQLERELGSGGMARVYLAIDLPHRRRVAIKVLHPELAGAVGQDRFLREIRIASDLSHPHILPLLDSGSTVTGSSSLPYYVMPYVEGESLRAKLHREQVLPIEEATKIAYDVATALSYAHARGVVHRDIKPENILLVGSEAVVADFGIARAIDRAVENEVITSAGLAVGTPAYMSPEQGAGHQEVDGRSDIYSLGCVLYEMLGGDPPFLGPNANAIVARHRVDPVPPLRTVRPSVPISLEGAVLRALEKVPADRFKTAEHFAAVLGQPHTPTGRTPSDAFANPRPSPTAITVETPGAWRPEQATRRVFLGLLLAMAVLLVWWAVSNGRWFEKRARYTDAPQWSAWRGWTGEFFPVFALDDSMLLAMVLSGDTAQRFDGDRWTPLPVPDSFRLLRYFGPVPGGHLLAARTGTLPTGPSVQYWWLRPTRNGFMREAAVSSELPDDLARPEWWSDGKDLVLWRDAIRHVEDSVLVREATGTTGGIRLVWGGQSGRRFAIPNEGRPLLEFDRVSWHPVQATDWGEGVLPTFVAGASFPDGGSAVLGLECTQLPSCRPVLLEQEASAGPWRRVPVEESLGFPTVMQPDTGTSCSQSQFEPGDIAGENLQDYYVWGSWRTCYPGLEQRETFGCPNGQPCTWHVAGGRLVPVQELVGKLVQSMGFQRGIPLALVNDGTVWRKTGGRWRVVTRVPGLPFRMIGASARMVVRLTGDRLRYEPGQGDVVSPYRVRLMDSIPISVLQGRPPARLLVRELRTALLTAEGEVFLSDCREEGTATGTGPPRNALSCDPFRRIPADRMRDLALLSDGTPIGISREGRILILNSSGATADNLPSPLSAEAFWGITVTDQGRTFAIGSHYVIERDSAGRWQETRRVSAPRTPHSQFLALPGGDLVLVERSIQVWDPKGDSLPAAVLYRPPLGADQLGAIHALPDGRLVAGLANPEDPLVSGRLLVWAAPARSNKSELVQLPVSMDITDLADDGRFLHVVGRGGTVMIPLTSLPFSTRPSP
jgi:tRNA A-37 threonylcarbamoyl transferase component Bud32